MYVHVEHGHCWIDAGYFLVVLCVAIFREIVAQSTRVTKCRVARKNLHIFSGHNFFINWVTNLKRISLETVYFQDCLGYTTIFSKVSPAAAIHIESRFWKFLIARCRTSGDMDVKWLQPPSALDLGYSMVLTQILFVSCDPKGKSPVETGLGNLLARETRFLWKLTILGIASCLISQ